MGGDEFVAVLAGVESAPAASDRALAVQAALDEEFVLRTDAGGGVGVRVGVSVGLAWTDGRLGVEALMREADRAMYRNKRLRQGQSRPGVADSASTISFSLRRRGSPGQRGSAVS